MGAQRRRLGCEDLRRRSVVDTVRRHVLWTGLVLGAAACEPLGGGGEGTCHGLANCTFTDMWEVGADDTDVVETVFELSHAADLGTLEVAVDDTVVPFGGAEGYTYDDTPPSITLHGGWVPERGMLVRASYVIQEAP